MAKKIFLYGIIFLLIASLNYYLSYLTYKNTNKELVIRRILSEIEQSNPVSTQFGLANAPIEGESYKANAELSDSRAANLKAFFRKHNSPLYNFAEKIVTESDKNGFDYRLLPAIAMQESTLCRTIPKDSYNCWGWGIYGTTVTRFSSYDEAIATIAKGLKEQYLDKGYITASSIMQKYTPSSSGSWAYAVNKFLRDLE